MFGQFKAVRVRGLGRIFLILAGVLALLAAAAPGAWEAEAGRLHAQSETMQTPGAQPSPAPGSDPRGADAMVDPGPISALLASASRANEAYHGNVKSRIFHRPGCRWYYCKNCTQVFATRAEAIAAGYRPCKVCKP